MDHNTIEIHDDEINVEEIMAKIREEIRQRKEAGLLPSDPPEVSPAPDPTRTSDLSHDLAYMTGNWNVQNTGYSITSHRPVTGRMLVKGRSLIHGEVRRYVDPMIWKQTEFNRNAARVAENSAQHIAELESQYRLSDSRLTELDALLHQFRNESDQQIHEVTRETETSLRDELQQTKEEVVSTIAEAQHKIDEQIRDIVAVQRDETEQLLQQAKADSINELALVKAEVETKVYETVKAEVYEAVKTEVKAEVYAEVTEEVKEQVRLAILAMNSDIENKAWLAQVLEPRIVQEASGEGPGLISPSTETGVNYFIFEETFRGSRKDIKQRQSAFFHYFEGCSNVLDIGCGRGEFLELMREMGIVARGVDLDETMVDYCRSRGLAVEHNDALLYLEELSDGSLDGIFIDQVVEHLEPAYLVRLLDLCHRKLKFGYYLIAETVNPLSFVSFANFYIDMTHVRPVHPETLRFLVMTAGFREIDVFFSSPVSDELRLRKIPVFEEMGEADRQHAEIYNRNIDLLNGTLYGAQDYAIVGKK